MNNWSLVYDSFEPEQEGLREALCTLGNGYFATRGAACEAKADDVHYPGTYLAGGYNRLTTTISGRVIENEDLVNLPNWLSLTFRIGEEAWFHLKAVEILSYRQELFLKEGVLKRSVRFRDAEGRESRLEERRFVHMRKVHLAAIELSLTAENWEGEVTFCSALDGKVENQGVKRYRELNSKHLVPMESRVEEDGTLFLKMETSQSELRLAYACKTELQTEGDVAKEKIEREGYTANHYRLTLAKGEKVALRKRVALYTSRDKAISEAGVEALEMIRNAPAFDELLESHKIAWGTLWHRFSLDLELKNHHGKRHHPVVILRLHLFHLLQTVSETTPDFDVGVPARGWHGEAYRGHIFWDEIFILPLVNFRFPEITEALLKYRHRRLDTARRIAREEGYEGAMYPWQSGSNGREESQLLHLNPKSGRWVSDNSRIQRHVNAAIAYNVWRYYEATGDQDFLLARGAEILIEVARFWASIASYNEALDCYNIKDVMGPDEYHDGYPGKESPGIDNNAYTNAMASWCLCRACDVFRFLPQNDCDEICQLLQIDKGELRRWDEVSRKLCLIYMEGGVISQFEGYEKLKELDWEAYYERYGDIHRLDRILEAEGDSANNYKVSKQADLLMLFYLFSLEELEELFSHMGHSFDEKTIKTNIDYYMRRTSHGSTLSRLVHSWVMAREQREGSWSLFLEALESDVADIQGGTTPEGIHLGAMAGTVDMVQRCYTGMALQENILWFNPHLPEEVKRLRLRIHYRGHSIEIDLTKEELRLESQESLAPPVRVGYEDKSYELKAGKALAINLGG